MALAPGMLVTESIRLVQTLSEGGMGSVWVADHESLRTRVAVKFVARELLDGDPSVRARFQREAMAAAQIKSPHVVQTLDNGLMDDGTPFIVMELLEGVDLRQRLDREQTLSLEETAEIVSQVAKALAKAHGAGIIHRDIKPDNIFLVDSGDDEVFVKVLDFGVAKHMGIESYSIVTSTGAMVGTPGYMSPEQVLHGSQVDLRTDLWSLAVVVHHCLIGDIPFQGETLGALCVAISRGTFTPPCSIRPELPKAIDAWMTRALALDPSDRFQTARQLAETFRAAAQGVAPMTAANAARPQPPGPPGGDPSSDQATTKVWTRPAEVDALRPESRGTPAPEQHAPTLPSAPGMTGDISMDATMQSTTGDSLEQPDALRTNATDAEMALPVRRWPSALVLVVAAMSFAIGFVLVVTLVRGGGRDAPHEPSTDRSPPDRAATASPTPDHTASAAADALPSTAQEGAPPDPSVARLESSARPMPPRPAPRTPTPGPLPVPKPVPARKPPPPPPPQGRDRGF